MRTNAFPRTSDTPNGAAEWSREPYEGPRSTQSVSAEMERIFGAEPGAGAPRALPSRAGGQVQTVALGAPTAAAKAVRVSPSTPARRPALLAGGALLVVVAGSAIGLTVGSPDLQTASTTARTGTTTPRPVPAPAEPASPDAYASAEALTPLTPLTDDVLAPEQTAGQPTMEQPVEVAAPVDAPSQSVPASADPFATAAPAPVASSPIASPQPTTRSASAQPAPVVVRQPAPTRVAVAPPPPVRRAQTSAPRIAVPAPANVGQRAEPPVQVADRGSDVGRPFTGARLLGGRSRNSDYPHAARSAGAEGTVHVRFAVAPNGRVGGCSVTRSSGNGALDATTCSLIRKRFRYEPARDVSGRSVSDVMEGRQVWWLVRDGADGDRRGAAADDGGPGNGGSGASRRR